MNLAGISGPKQAEHYGVGALYGSVSGAYRTFQTVSWRSSQNLPSETVWKIAGRPLEGALLAPGGGRE